MIKVTVIPSDIKTNQHLFLISGGPGISSLSIRDLDLLKRSFHMHYVDFPGTNKNPYLGKKSFDELSDLLLDEIKKIDGRVFCLGHSFGGLFAMDMAIQSVCDGIICIATPLTNRSLQGAIKEVPDELKRAKKVWDDRPSDETFRAWLAAYAPLWFTANYEMRGRELMASDPVSAQFYLDNEDDIYRNESLLMAVSKWDKKKVLIAGEDDRAFAWEDLRHDAASGNFDFIQLKNASHFVMVDQPLSLAKIIEEAFLKN